MKESSCRDNREATEEASIFGFGSFFNGKKFFQDIDLLILHESTTKESCKFALLCKKYISSKIPCVHITILSSGGELQHNFINKCNAIFLGKVSEESCFESIDRIIDTNISINYN